MADLLMKGDAKSFSPFEAEQDRLIHLAARVDGYVGHPFEDEVDGLWWPWWKKQQIENKRNFLDVAADIMEHVDPVFYGEPRAAALKALALS